MGEADGIVNPADSQRIALETVVVQAIGAGADNRDLVLLGEGEASRDDLGIVQRHLIVHQAAADGDLYAVETELGGEGNGFRIGGEAEVPIGDPDRDFGGGSPDERRGHRGGKEFAACHDASIVSRGACAGGNLTADTLQRAQAR